MFQSTHPRGVRHEKTLQSFLPFSFNPRTHVGCDESKLVNNAKTKVSIHAPTWGATYWYRSYNTYFLCFNPRTHVGCDTSFYKVPLRTLWFQSTHPRGVRQRQDKAIKAQKVSIHAPTWGATRRPCRDIPEVRVSIHAPTWGATSCIASCSCAGCFNPRTHVGCDPLVRGLTVLVLRFNPRTHVGCDTVKKACSRVPFMFQSTHPRGVRQDVDNRKYHSF